MINLLTAQAPNFFERIVIFLQKKADWPTNYGWFHLMFAAILVVSCVLACVFLRNCSKKAFRNILLVSWIVLVVFEVYKEVVFAYHFDAESGLGFWKYDWGSFPFQLCSTPFYVLPFAIFLKDGKVKDAFLWYLAFFSLFGGLCVYVFPNDVFHTDYLGVQIQTMVHHGLQIFLAVFIVAHERARFTVKSLLLSIPVFVVMLLIALLLNVVGHKFIEGTFNMFYIGPYYPCHLPLLSVIYEKVPFVVFLLIYAVGFVVCAFLMFAIEYGVLKLCQKLYSKKHG